MAANVAVLQCVATAEKTPQVRPVQYFANAVDKSSAESYVSF